MTVTVLVCGGGHGAHVMAALVSSKPDMTCRVLALSQAREWAKAAANNILTCSFPSNNGKSTLYTANPHTISDNPAEVVPGADIIVLVVPAFSQGKYLAAIEPHIQKKTILVALPGQAGFEYQACHILRNKFYDLTIISAESLPWACRISVYGVKVDVIGIKELLKMVIVHNDDKILLNPFRQFQHIWGTFPVIRQVSHSLGLTHMVCVTHLGICYGKWNDWDTTVKSEIPLFYHGTDDIQAQWISRLDGEINMIKLNILRERPNETTSGLQWLLDSYGSSITDSSSLKHALTTNKGYEGLFHPMITTEEGFIPDFKSRYLKEDVPFGIVVFKGLAQIVGLYTPAIDTVLHWSQQKLGKIYIVGSKLCGQDLHETRAPQVYGIKSLEDLEKFI
ncbi:opine dehydrogenase-like [Haliotis cracherodii]|uniref:opine dehydrogenase-like n=1 Tax=Haliotis cracherodii TaxID=6455 RepID=UPI0039EA726C